ncbi:histidine phosphatase family protein [Phenylobacterium sp.]|uniref:SixA phosphatase family protein n=1 Tax=Phenylobacterium sp. TaxID=1871053 RepID=UPI0025E751D2|nr:histidine phosphatase family protein [Phenylobacterium sp.]MBX3482716.1 histidine phosphatase family protein [Phenylobacterium sp.]MCW5760053.1 histidine phosphatase family protein [Phenylobacterium sp.]
MDRLILLRHGKAEPDSASGDDFDRRLAPRGQEESAGMGAHLAGLGFTPDVALVSSAARTRDTWAAMQPIFARTEMRIEDHLYHADSGTIRAAAEQAGEACRTLMIVGHNPGLQELTIQLLQEGGASPDLIGKARRNFPTAAAAVFLIDANGRPHYDGLFFPGRYH